jgi:hypothetical protein
MDNFERISYERRPIFLYFRLMTSLLLYITLQLLPVVLKHAQNVPESSCARGMKCNQQTDMNVAKSKETMFGDWKIE